MVRQNLFLSEILFNFCERRNRYTITAWDETMARVPTDEEFQSLPKIFETREDSTCFCRYCCKNYREMKLGIFPPFIRNEGQGTFNLRAPGYPEDGTRPLMELVRPFRCTILCCCCVLNPQEMSVMSSAGTELGQTMQDWRCFQACFCCTQYDKTFGPNHELKYVSAWHPFCCAPGDATGGFNNCCAPTCFNPVFTIPVFDPSETQIVALIENVWPGCNFRGLCGQGFSNWVLKFPTNATGEEKALLLSNLFLQEFQHFERNSQENK